MWQCLSYKLEDSDSLSSEHKCIGDLCVRDAQGKVTTWRGNLWDYLHHDVKCRRMRVTRNALSDIPFDFWGG